MACRRKNQSSLFCDPSSVILLFSQGPSGFLGRGCSSVRRLAAAAGTGWGCCLDAGGGGILISDVYIAVV